MALGGQSGSALNLGLESFQILGIGRTQETGERPKVLGRIKGLRPLNLGSTVLRKQFDAQCEWMPAQVLKFNEFAIFDAREAAFVGVIAAVRGMHGQSPNAAWHKVKLVKGVCETMRPPPPSHALRLTQGGKHLAWAGLKPLVLTVRSGLVQSHSSQMV